MALNCVACRAPLHPTNSIIYSYARLRQAPTSDLDPLGSVNTNAVHRRSVQSRWNRCSGRFGAPRRLKQCTPFGCIVRLPRRQRERYSRSSIRGNHMNLGVPTASVLANRSGAALFSAPAPSGCTLTLVLSSDTASIFMRTTCAR
jgi:hypothetical protein